MASSSSPEGLIIHRKWRIGKKLGDGVCGCVHELVSASASGEIVHAIKLAPLPDPSVLKKKENLERKKHADILHYESLIYQNHLVELRGMLIPELPLRPVTGDVEGESKNMCVCVCVCSINPSTHVHGDSFY